MKIKQFLSLLAAVTLLTGCVEMGPDARLSQMTFDNMKSVQVDVARIEIRNDYKPPMQDPNIEHLFATPPYAAAETLIKKQLVAAGTDNVLRVIIDDASVIKEELPVDRGIVEAITREPSERLKAKVLLRFELVSVSSPDIVLGHAEVIAKRTRTLLEGISLADREESYFTLTEDLMDDLNDGLLTVVKNSFGKKN